MRNHMYKPGNGRQCVYSVQDAALFLNVSRPFVVKQIEAGKLPVRKVEGHHTGIVIPTAGRNLLCPRKIPPCGRNDNVAVGMTISLSE